jgi:hypothetical protein
MRFGMHFIEIDGIEQSKTVVRITFRQKLHDAERITAAHIIVNGKGSHAKM